MGNWSAKFGNLDVLILGLTPTGKEIRYKSTHKINELPRSHGSRMGGSIFTKQTSQLQFKAKVVKSDSALETVYLIQLNHMTIDTAEIFPEIILCTNAGLSIILLFVCCSHVVKVSNAIDMSILN